MPHPLLIQLAMATAPGTGASGAVPPEQIDRLRSLVFLLLMIALLAIIALGALAIALARLRAHDRKRERAADAARQSNPWAEAGRRFQPPAPGDDDTVDLDPSDLDPDDVGPGPRAGPPRRPRPAGPARPPRKPQAPDFPPGGESHN